LSAAESQKTRSSVPEFDPLLRYEKKALNIRRWAVFAEMIGTVPELLGGCRLGAVHRIWIAPSLSRITDLLRERHIPVSFSDTLATAVKAKDPKAYPPLPDVRAWADDSWEPFLVEFAQSRHKRTDALQVDELSEALSAYLSSVS
jgi:hypothetical protein